MCAYAGLPPQGNESDITLAQINAYVDAENDRRKFYTDLAQYVVYFVVHGPRLDKTVPIAEIDPIKLMDDLRQEAHIKAQANPASQKELSDARKKEIRDKMDRMQYVEHHQKQNKKKVNNS